MSALESIGSVIPMQIVDDNGNIVEEIICASISGGAEFRPPGVTHSAPLGRRSFLQIPPPLRVTS